MAGRKPIDPKEKRVVPLRIMLTQAEHDEVVAAAKRNDFDKSVWARRLILQAARKKSR